MQIALLYKWKRIKILSLVCSKQSLKENIRTVSCPDGISIIFIIEKY